MEVIMLKVTLAVNVLMVAVILVFSAYAAEQTVELEAAGNITTWSTTTYRMMDIADNLYESDYQDRFDYYVESPAVIELCVKNPSTWTPVPGGASGELTYHPTGPTFDYEFDASGLNPVEYSLVYYPDPWPGYGLIILGTGTPSGSGDLHLEGSLDTGDLPIDSDPNPGAKIWLVPSSYVNQNQGCMSGWNSSLFLLEIEQITYEKKYHPEVSVSYYDVGTTFAGSLIAVGLKPNFAYQLKLVGKPENDPQWGTAGDDWSNQSIGYAGRWFEQAPGSGNRTDAYVTPLLSNPDYVFEGYLLFDFFITDENGDANLDFALNSSYHVLWKESQRLPQPNDSDTKWRTFNVNSSSIAYDFNGGPFTEGIYAEWQNDRPTSGNVNLPAGQYDVQVLLTEESFHSSGLGGYWAAAMVCDQVEFTIVDEHLMLYKKNPSNWQPMQTNEIAGEMVYSTEGPEFSFVFDTFGLNPADNYSLIYYPDPWPGWNLIVLDSGTPDQDGNLHLENSLDTGDLPAPFDANYPDGAKIWLVLSSDVSTGSPQRMIGWHQSQYLFENNLITYEQTVGTSGENVFDEKIEEHSIPSDFSFVNHPNPFNPTTTIRFGLPKAADVRLTVFNTEGRKVVELLDGYRQAGDHAITWDASSLPSGIYICRIQAGDFTVSRKMVLVK
jgi:hypothetical protein